MSEDVAAQLLEQLRIAEKKIDEIYQLCSIQSEVDRSFVCAKAARAKAAVQLATTFAQQLPNNN